MAPPHLDPVWMEGKRADPVAARDRGGSCGHLPPDEAAGAYLSLELLGSGSDSSSFGGPGSGGGVGFGCPQIRRRALSRWQICALS